MAKTKKVTRKPTAKRAKQALPKTGTTKMSLLSAKPDARRPPSNPDMPKTIIAIVYGLLSDVRGELDEYAQHLRSLDRKRLNGVGVKKLGFIERAYEIALENSEFLPHYLTIERFGKDIEYFMDFRTMLDMCKQIEEKLWNITMQSADIAYTDALEFYASVREAAKRRVDAAEAIHGELSRFFKRSRSEAEEPTEKQLKREAISLISGRHDGKLVIENTKPKLIRGRRKVFGERHNDTALFKDTVSGEIEE